MNTRNLEAAQKPFPVAWVMMLGMMVAIGPLAIDMYLPALPSMADDFGVPVSNVAMSVPAYFIGLVVGQLFYGPFSDRVGRVLPMYIGMTVFVVASIICALTNNEIVLFAARTMQALGACVTAVVTRAAIRDTMNPIQGARAFSLMVLVMGVAPILAPTLGALILKLASWHALFWFLAGYGALNLILTKLFLKETLAPENRNTKPVSETFKGYASLVKDKTFIVPAVAGGLLQGAFFIYLSISSELFMVHYHLSEQQFAIAFGANAFGFIALTQVNQFLTKRFRLVQLLRFGTLMQLVSALCLLFLGVFFSAQAYMPAVILAIFCCIAGLGFTQPNATAIALAHQKKRAGMASALQGALQFSVGIFGGVLLSLFDVSPVIKLGIVTSTLVAIGTLLVYRLDAKMDLSGVD
ncbi:Bcr/CflA family drug resistance efflux transporter [Moraxella caviae]|uniref:Bcr/CflA family efflux transporter n=1 Tax=Moraxella caviae TaxID=34060 RepID=A0A1T0A1H0_9GAMM|nr:multidrug effflux MFS transporter [Moraxella caviae]OOR89590.1 Bcr/CflA family drug resistance efflux transporter [Moraxella caviae]STZ10272.1 Sulfonamide resistance protein [Moraxella caviae]VEW11255.1 Sulfonamide resistance protein [Moraxella caviae]